MTGDERPPFRPWIIVVALSMFLAAPFVCLWLESKQEPPPAKSAPLTAHATPRSGRWPKVRADFLASHSTCQACGRTAKQSGQAIEAHHCVPFHDDQAQELDPNNLIALCRRCHELLGHLDKWASHNPDVRDDAERMLMKIKARP